MAQEPRQPPEQEQELSRRVIYALMLPVVRLGFAFKVPIKEMGDLLQMAYYHETRRRGLKMREASTLLDVSMRKVALLSKRLKRNFLEQESEHELPRRLEFVLWAAPISEGRLLQALPEHDLDEIRDALHLLLRQGRIREVPGRTVTYEVVKTEARLVQGDWLARLDGLNNLLASLTHAVQGRFFQDEPDAFARTISLHIRPQDMGRLKNLYEDVIWKTLSELEELARDAPEARPIDVSLIWAPQPPETNPLEDPEASAQE